MRRTTCPSVRAPFPVFALAIAAALTGGACRENLVRPSGPAASVGVAPDTLTLVRGDSARLVATARNASGAPLGAAGIAWSTSDAAVATVRPTGLVSAVGPGVATIAATADGATGTARIAVVPRITEIRVAPHGIALVPGGRFPLAASGVDVDAGIVTGATDVVWTSDDPTVVSVSAAGEVAAGAPGTAWVRATRGALRDSAHVLVQTVRFTQVSASPYFHTCATGPAGAYCWGYEGLAGNLGTGARVARVLTPVGVEDGARFASVSAGDAFTCGLTPAGAAWCWGDGTYGRLGSGGPDTILPSPTRVAWETAFRALSAGRRHACALTPEGSAWCWGGNSTGALGLPTTTETSPVPVLAQEELLFVSVGAGFLHSCALAADGTAYCWGRGMQLGDSVGVSRHTAAPVAGGHRFTMLSVGWNHSCGLTADGTAYCWGFNFSGETGAPPPETVLAPVPVTGAPPFARVVAGHSGSCGLTAAGAAYCWGSNNSGQLGTGDTLSGPTPRPAAGGLRFAALSLGNEHSCGIGLDGLAYCWGSGLGGMLGDGTDTGYRTTPAPVSGQAPAAAPARRSWTRNRDDR